MRNLVVEALSERLDEYLRERPETVAERAYDLALHFNRGEWTQTLPGSGAELTVPLRAEPML